MFEKDANLGPWRTERKAFRPFENDDGRLGENVFHAECFEIVEFFDAIKVAMENFLLGVFGAVNVKESKRGTRHVVFGSGTESADDSFGQRGFAAAKIAGEENHQRRFYARSEFPAPGDGFFGGVRDDFFRHRSESPEEVCGAPWEWQRRRCSTIVPKHRPTPTRVATLHREDKRQAPRHEANRLC